MWGNRIASGGVALLGSALGVSQVVHGIYDETVWAPIALGALGLVVALAVTAARPPPLPLLAPILGLWLWSLVSAAWSDSTDAAHVVANRWLLYGAAIVVLSWAVDRDRNRANLLLTSASAGVVGVTVWMLIRMLSGHGPALFLGTRLNDPLGYVNGQAGYLLAAAWPCLALAEHRGSKASPTIAGAGMAALVALLGVGLLCQSRSWELALAGAIVLLEIAVPGRRRRAAALLLAAGTIAVIYTPLSRVWRDPSQPSGLVTAGATRHAAAAIILAAIVSGVTWAAAAQLLHRLAPAGSSARVRVRRFGSATLVMLGIAAAIGIGVGSGGIARQIHNQYEAFVRLAPASGSTRLVSGAGNRYDYWRVAVVEFRSAPIKGVGAGNYDVGYYLHRRTTEAITQPHSLELQTLAELGLVGALLLAAFLGVVAVGAGRTARAGRHNLPARRLAVGAVGIFAVWLIQTSVDWMQLIPGLTAIALAAAVGLVSGPDSGGSALTRRARIAMIAAAVAIAVAGTLTIAPRLLSLDAQASAQRELDRGNPRAAIHDATTALEYDSRSVSALVLRAAAFARTHEFAPSLGDLRRAAAFEPRNWVNWALVGDLLTRRGDRRGAISAYRRALALDPLEPDLHSALAALERPSAG